MTIAMNSDSSLRFIDFIKYPSFLMSGGTRPTGQAAMAACRISLRPYYTTRLWKVRIETVSFLHHFLIPAALRAFQPGPMVYWTEKRGGRFPGEGIFFGGAIFENNAAFVGRDDPARRPDGQISLTARRGRRALRRQD